MGPLGLPELIFILVLALLIFGPRRLPEVGRTVGKALGEFRRATSELTRTLNSEVALEEERPRRAPSPTSTAAAAATPVVQTSSPEPGREQPDDTVSRAAPASAEESAGEPEAEGGGEAEAESEAEAGAEVEAEVEAEAGAEPAAEIEVASPDAAADAKSPAAD